LSISISLSSGWVTIVCRQVDSCPCCLPSSFSLLAFSYGLDPSLKESVVIKAATVISLMAVGQKRIQDRFADRGIIAWVLGTCYQSIQDSDKSLINAGSYCLLVRSFQY
jgi:hypothetical protein